MAGPKLLILWIPKDIHVCHCHRKYVVVSTGYIYIYITITFSGTCVIFFPPFCGSQRRISILSSVASSILLQPKINKKKVCKLYLQCICLYYCIKHGAVPALSNAEFILITWLLTYIVFVAHNNTVPVVFPFYRLEEPTIKSDVPLND